MGQMKRGSMHFVQQCMLNIICLNFAKLSCSKRMLFKVEDGITLELMEKNRVKASLDRFLPEVRKSDSKEDHWAMFPI